MKVPKKLSREWSKKLQQSGFDDIEFNGQVRQETLGKAETAKDISSDLDFLHNGHFRSKVDRRIWEMHCDGKGQRQIAAELCVGRWVVSKSIKRSQSGKAGKLGKLTKSEIRRTVRNMDIRDVFFLVGSLVD